VANLESLIQSQIMLALSESGVLVWRQHVGTFRPIHGGAPIKIGLTGMADLGAILPVVVTPDMVGRTVGMACQIEVKTPTGRQASAQQCWQAAVEYRGGRYIVGRSAEDVIAALGINRKH
jgi:hypothetical protein